MMIKNEPSRTRVRSKVGDFSSARCCLLFGLASAFLLTAVPSRAADPAADFRKNVQPILAKYCYDCHGDGEKKGQVTLDSFKSNDALLSNHDLWWRVLKNTRAGIMPPHKKEQPTPEEKLMLADWIKRGPFGLDPKNPDPGRVTIRRLNRVENRNTIHDLMGIDY